MFESLTKGTKPSDWLGVRIGTIGALIAMASFAVAAINVYLWLDLPLIGVLAYYGMCLGVALGFVGMIVHFYIMLFKKT